MNKPLRVWSADRTKRYGIVAASYEDMLVKSARKLELNSNNLRAVLEDDGTNVDKDFWEKLTDHTRLLILQEHETWKPSFVIPFKDAEIKYDVPDGSLDERALAEKHLIELQKNPAFMVLLNLSDMEIIKDADIDELDSNIIDKSFAKELQQQCINLYIKRKEQEEAVEFLNLMKERKE